MRITFLGIASKTLSSTVQIPTTLIKGEDGKSLQFVVITQADYDALSLAEKEDMTKAYMVI